MTKVPGGLNMKVGSPKESCISDYVKKRVDLPSPVDYAPSMGWLQKNNFLKQSTTPKVTMTAGIMKKKQSVGPGYHKIKYDSKYHGHKIQLVAKSNTPQLMAMDHYEIISN